MKKLLFGLFMLSATSSFAKTIPVDLDTDIYRDLGSGYDTRKDLLLGKCVDLTLPGSGPKMELTTGSFNLSLESDQSAIADKLGISVKGRYTTGATTVSASADFLNESAKNAFNLSYTYIAEFHYKEILESTRDNLILPMPGFTKIVGQKTKFYHACGDEYVHARNRAARVLVNVSLSFVSQSEKNNFAATMGLDSPMTKLAANMEQNHSNFSSANRMTIRVHQIGGDPAKIGQVLCPPNHDGTLDANCEKSSKDVVDCGFGDITKCVNIIAGAIAYTNAQDGNNFPAQIADGKNYEVTTLETIPYVTLGDPFVAPPPPQDEAVLAMSEQSINDLFKVQYDDWVLARQFVIGRAPRLSDREKSDMEQVENLHAKNSVKIVDSLERCLDAQDVKECSKEIDASRAIVGLDKDGNAEEVQYKHIMDLTAPETFVQYCDLASSQFPDIQKTVDTLQVYAVAKAGEEQLNFAKGDRCFILSDWLSKQKEIDLSGNTAWIIGDLAPIGTLTRLEKLNLSGQKIESVDDLAGLVNLRELILDNNQISDLAPLEKMFQLKRLSVQNNQIESLAALSVLASSSGHLQKVDARGNSESLTCPLTNTTGCKILSFADYANISSASTKCQDISYHEAVAIDEDTILATGGVHFPDVSSGMQLVRNSDCRTLAQTLSVPRMGHTMTMTNKGILVVGGGTDVIEYVDPSTFVSQVVSDKMPTPIFHHTATRLANGDVLIVGGATDANVLTGFQEPSGLSDLVHIIHEDGRLELIGRLSVPRASHTATLLDDGSVLILGGYSLNGMVDIAEVISPENKTVVALTKPLPVGRAGHAAVKLASGHVFIAGGFKWTAADKENPRRQTPLDSLVDFDPKTQTFHVLEEKLQIARGNLQSVVTTDHRVLLIGGQTELKTVITAEATPVLSAKAELQVRAASSVIEVYDPYTESIYYVADLLNHLTGFTATSLGQNSVMIFGGHAALTVSDDKTTVIPEKMLTSAELLVYRPR